VSLEPYAEQLVAETQSWDEYMFLPTYEEQAEMLVRAFPKEALQFAWQDHPEYLRTLPRGTTTVEIGDQSVEDLEAPPHTMPHGAQRVNGGWAAPSRPTGVAQGHAAAAAVTAAADDVPFDVPGELSEDESAGVDNMFAAADDSAPAATQRPAANVQDIIAKARQAAARKR
jgi:hypothetical protein